MKRALGFGALLVVATAVFAATNAEIRCAVLGMGGGISTSPSYTLQSYVGPTVVGVSTSPSHGLIHGPVPCSITGATGIEVPDAGVPKVLRLHQNAPNPFNPRTTIVYELPRDASRVQLLIYDVAGHRIRTLVDGPETAGKKTAVWNGRDELGHPVSSGVYLYELIAPDRRLTRKMTLLK